MSVDIAISIVGSAGQGVQLLARALAQAFVRSGYYTFCSHDVMSRIRGGQNCSRLRVADQAVAADRDASDLLVVLEPHHLAARPGELRPDGWVIVDSDVSQGEHVLIVPLFDMALKSGGGKQAVNIVAAGAVWAVLGCELSLLVSVLRDMFGSRGETVVAANIAAAVDGYNHAARTVGATFPVQLPQLTATEPRVLIAGSEAIALGALAAGVELVAGYPMSPGTPILEYCARHGSKIGTIVEQTEDEVAAANMAIGAFFAGKRAMVATAGGGFALMNEALSLAGITETPIVFCVGMRPGPATGMATRTAQADLLWVIHAGHGEFPRAVLTPADALDAFRGVQQACYLAERFQIPVILLYDQFLGDALWTIPAGALSYRVPRLPADPAPAVRYAYRRYALAPDGVSPRLLPGVAGQLVYVDSDEHTEQGHITESAEVRVQQVRKRARKLLGVATQTIPPTEWPANNTAETVVLCFGSTRGIVREAVNRLRDKGQDIGMLHFEQVWPFPAETVKRVAGHTRRLVTVEGNATGQLGQLVAQECSLAITGSVLRFDGRQLRVGQVEQALAELLVGGNETN